jgi:hypothetical protein
MIIKGGLHDNYGLARVAAADNIRKLLDRYWPKNGIYEPSKMPEEAQCYGVPQTMLPNTPEESRKPPALHFEFFAFRS